MPTPDRPYQAEPDDHACTETLEDEDGRTYRICQEPVGAERVVGGGEFPDPATPRASRRRGAPRAPNRDGSHWRPGRSGLGFGRAGQASRAPVAGVHGACGSSHQKKRRAVASARNIATVCTPAHRRNTGKPRLASDACSSGNQ
jgi:hypothetical protein